MSVDLKVPSSGYFSMHVAMPQVSASDNSNNININININNRMVLMAQGPWLQNLSSSVFGKASRHCYAVPIRSNFAPSQILTSTVARRFYFPTVPTTLHRKSSPKQELDRPQTDQKDDGDKTIMFKSKWTAWTAEERDLVKKFAKENKMSPQIYQHFPGRSVATVEVHLYRARKELMEEKGDDKYFLKAALRKQTRKPVWTATEDARLRERVERLGCSSWAAVCNDMQDGSIIGRTSTSCQRRWDIISSTSERKVGRWNAEEDQALHMALTKQLGFPSEEATIKQMKLIIWDEVAKEVETRSAIQCRSRVHKSWPTDNKGRWTSTELQLLEQAVLQPDTDWKKLEELFPDRLPYHIKLKVFNLYR
ncbi:Myb-like DNA-binding domain protein [Mortierella claussenii]|nr:Myb-like DNA-binding domain protein [Mortierella claussenii]